MPAMTQTTPAEPAANALTRVGGNTTEATTTSTTTVNLLSVTGLSIAAAAPILIVGVGRKTVGAGDEFYIGLSLNSTVVSEAEAGNGSVYQSTLTNRAETGGFFLFLPPRVASYLRTGSGRFSNYTATGVAATLDTYPSGQTNDAPTVAITSITLRAHVDNALITGGADELQVYSSAIS